MRSMLVALLAAALFGAPPASAAPATAFDDTPFWTGTPGVAEFNAAQQARIARAEALIAAIKEVQGRRTVDNTLRPYDEALRHLSDAARQSGLVANTHPDEAMRTDAEALQQQISSYVTSLSVDPGLYRAMAAVDAKKADAATRHYLERELRDFRLAGVDRDEATRAKIQAVQDELVKITQAFNRNIRADESTVEVEDAALLAGLPADYIAKHPPGENGRITLTTQGPDAFPVFSYAQDDGLRRRMYMAYMNRAYPANMDVLDQMIAKRHELAALLGFAHFADLVTADRMTGNARTASEFIDRIVGAARPIGAREYAQLLARKRKDDPAATAVTDWERSYYSELVRKSDYDFDGQSVRPYFPYARVKQGVLDVTAKLFGVEFRRVADAPVWHPSVEC